MENFIPKIPAEYVMPLNMNGLRGRMVRVPSSRKTKKRELLLVYGHHASLERTYGFAEVLREYGNVTIPDLPGFGGMDSFYRIGETPDLDTLADYLASFVALRYRNRRITLIGFSFGFLVVTRMLQRYPDLAKKTDMVVSLAGFARYDDFVFSPVRRRMYLTMSRIFVRPIPAWLFRNTALHPSLIRKFYKHTHNAKDKFEGLDPARARAMTEFEVHLWRCNEVRTYMKTSSDMLTVDNCTSQVKVPAWHVSVGTDKYFNNEIAEQHLRVIYSNLETVQAVSKKHSPVVIANKKEAAVFFPRALRAALNSKT